MTDVVVAPRGADRFGLAVAVLAAVFSLIASLASADPVPAAAKTGAEGVLQMSCRTSLGSK